MRTMHGTEAYTLLRGTVGSTIHGLHLEGTDDRDEMAVAIEPPEFLIGLARARFDFDGQFQQGYEHHVERTKNEGERSGPGDLDRVTYSLRKWMKLAAEGNPTALLLLWVPSMHCDVFTSYGKELQALAPAIVSKQCGPRFMGYLGNQKQRLLGLKGQKRVKRPELEEAHGFDTKYAMHILRLAVQGIEILQTGQMTLPMEDNARMLIRSVREGKFSKGETIDLIEKYEGLLADAVRDCKLPDNPSWTRINSYLVCTYREVWGW